MEKKELLATHLVHCKTPTNNDPEWTKSLRRTIYEHGLSPLDPIDALLLVYKDGTVDVKCPYYKSGMCIISVFDNKDCCYKK